MFYQYMAPNGAENQVSFKVEKNHTDWSPCYNYLAEGGQKYSAKKTTNTRGKTLSYPGTALRFGPG